MKQKLSKKIIKYFDSLVEKTLFKLKDKINIFFHNNSKVSNFNKFIITFISLLFLYLFYLLIPSLYNKTWIQNNIETRLYKEFKINFSISSDIKYRILPSPHFLIKDSKIFKEDLEKAIPISEIKNLKVFIDQKNFFNKEKLTINKVIIDKANFSLLKNDFKTLSSISNKKFSNNSIEIRNSKIFFKDKKRTTIIIVKITKAFLFFDDLKLLNLFNLKGELFNIPFVFDLNNEIYGSKNNEIYIEAKKLKLKILNNYNKKSESLIDGLNTILIGNSKIFTKYNIEDHLIFFESGNSKIKNSKINHIGKLSFDPFDLKLDIRLEDYTLSELLNIDSVLGELIKTKLLFNKNISMNSSITTTSRNKDDIFDTVKINFNIFNGEISLDHTKFINNKIGIIALDNNSLFFQEDKLILRSDIIIDIHNSNNLYSYLQTSKKFRKPIKNIFINLDYDFLSKHIEFNNIKIDGANGSKEILTIFEEFNDYSKGNLNRGRNIINKLLSVYEG